MSDDDEFYKEKTGEITAAGVAAVATAITNNPYLAALSALAPAFGAMIAHSMARRWASFWRGARSVDPSATDEDTARNLAASQDEPAAQDAVLEAFRRLRDALDHEAAFALGRMTFLYQHSGKKPDRFFRDFGSLLADSSTGEIDQLRRVLRAVVAREWGATSVPLRRVVDKGAVGVGFDANVSELAVLCSNVDQRLLFRTLQRFGLADAGTSVFGAGPEDTLELDLVQADRMLRVIDIAHSPSSPWP